MKITQFLGGLSLAALIAGCAAERPVHYSSNSTYGDPTPSSSTYDSTTVTTSEPRYDSYQGAAASAQVMTESDRALVYQARQRCERITPGATVTLYSRNGSVTVSGTVSTEQDRLAVVNAVRGTPGVVAVSDQLQITGPPIASTPTGRYEQERVYAPSSTDFFSLHVRGLNDTDRVLGQRILEGLRGDTVLPTLMPVVNIEVADNRVTVRGSVQSHEQKRSILSAVQRAAGVNNVYDELQVSPLPR
jgi:hypothetical protein